MDKKNHVYAALLANLESSKRTESDGSEWSAVLIDNVQYDMNTKYRMGKKAVAGYLSTLESQGLYKPHPDDSKKQFGLVRTKAPTAAVLEPYAQTLKVRVQNLMSENNDGPHLSLNGVHVLREVLEFLDHPIINQSPEVSKAMMTLIPAKD